MIRRADEIEALAETVADNGGVVLRAGVLGAVRAALAARRARRDRRPDPLREQGPHRPGRARGDRVPDPRGRRGDATPTPASTLDELRVDGGMTRNELLMQFQADILGVP